MENAGGISICYPYQTDEDYRDACIEMQEYLGFAPNYTRFLQDFYAIQNGDTLLADREISNAHTTVTTENDGTYDESDITLQLTPEQQANSFSARPKKKVTLLPKKIPELMRCICSFREANA